MERNFDFGALFKTQTHEKKHKNKPTNFVSVAGGIQKRLECSIKNRKSNRLTAFDTIRKLPECPSPAPISEAKQKMEHRRQQLEKWKIEKEQKKKELAAQKKKPFITGVARNPQKFVPPPPPPKPSASGRVTRSMARSTLKQPVKLSPKNRNTQSFAPKNATFKPPELKNLVKLPKLAPPSRTKSKKDITFEPVVHTTTTVKQSRTRPTLTRQNATETKSSLRSMTEVKNTRSKVKKPSPKKPLQSSSSSSDVEPTKLKARTPRKSLNKPKQLTPKVLAMQSTSDEKSSAESSNDIPKRKSLRSTYAVKDSESSSTKTSTDMEPSYNEPTTTVTKLRKSLPKNYSPRPLRGTSSSDRVSSDVEFIDEQLPAVKSRKSLPATPRNRIPKSESSSEEKLRSPKSPLDLALTPEKIEDAKNTPSITMSRGKDNARKEAIWKMKEGLLDDDASDQDSVQHFRQQLAAEVARISDLCAAWDKVSQQAALPEFVQEAILAAVGQGRLLVSQKLQQFASLVERCARPDPRAALVTPADLQGFWDMVFIQVTNVDLRFKKLEELRLRNWVEEVPIVAQKFAAKPTAKVARKAKPAAATSRIQQMIAEKRKAMQRQEQAQSCEGVAIVPADAEKTFEAGFFTVRSPVRSPAPATPKNKHNLLKAVLSSEAKKASKSPFAMLRASMLAKNAEHDGIAPLPQTPKMNPDHLFATPGKSILKSTNKPTNVSVNKSGKKSMKVVLFHASDSDNSDTFTLSDHKEMFQTAVEEDLIKFDNTVDNLDKENSPSPVIKTRRQSKRLTLNTTDTEIATPRRSSRRKTIDDTEDTKKTPSRITNRKKAKEAETPNEVPGQQKTKKMTRKKALQDSADNVTQENIPTPKRSSRRNKVSTIIS